MSRFALAALAPLALVAFVACGGDDTGNGDSTPAPGTTTQGPNLRDLKGEIIVDGSSTVYPVTAAAAEEFGNLAPNVRISVGISGTGGGFKKFCVGETDIQDASRPIDPNERDACAANGIEYIELPVAYDGLSVIVHPANDWVQCLTVQELRTIWSPESQGKVTRWNQVRPSFPDRPLVLFGAGTDSGTFDYFTQAVNGKEKASRGDYQATEDDNVTITGVAGERNALGYLGFAYVVENPGKVKPVAIDAGNGTCVEPSEESIRNGTYQPLSRPIFIYVRKEAAERPEVQAFVRFYLSKEFTSLIPTPEVGYVPLPDEVYEAVLRRFENKTLGTLFPNGAEVGATLDRYLQAR